MNIKLLKMLFLKLKIMKNQKLFDEFRETQLSFQQKQMQGEEIPEEDLAKLKNKLKQLKKMKIFLN